MAVTDLDPSLENARKEEINRLAKLDCSATEMHEQGIDLDIIFEVLIKRERAESYSRRYGDEKEKSALTEAERKAKDEKERKQKEIKDAIEKYVEELSQNKKDIQREVVLDPKTKPIDIAILFEKLMILDKRRKIEWRSGEEEEDSDKATDPLNFNNPLQLAIIHKKFDLIEPLLKMTAYYAKYNIPTITSLNRDKHCCLTTAITALDNEQEVLKVLRIILSSDHEDIKSLLNYGSGFGVVDTTVQYFKHAMERRYYGVIEFLVNHPLFEAKSFDGLGTAIKLKNDDAFRIFLESDKFYVNRLHGRYERESLTALMMAVEQENTYAASLLLKHPEMNIDKEDNLGQTALFKACNRAKSNETIIRLLLKYNADIHHADINCQTPLHVATQHGFITQLNAWINECQKAGRSTQERKTKLDKPKIKSFEEILGLFNKRIIQCKHIMMDVSLYAHVNIDHRIAGNKLEGNQLGNSLRFAMDVTEFLMSEASPYDIKEYQEKIERFAKAISKLYHLNKEFEAIKVRALVELRTKYDSQKNEEIQKILEEMYLKIEANYLRDQEVLFSGGWQSRAGGHAMIHHMQEDKATQDILFSVYNTGSGVNFHEAYEGNKYKRNPKFTFKIPKENKSLVKEFIIELLRAQYSSLWEGIEQNAKNIYTLFLKFINRSRAELISLQKEELWTCVTTQRGGSCAFKVVNALAKVWLPEPVFNMYKFEGKLISNLLLFRDEYARGRLDHWEIYNPLREGIANFSRYLGKGLETKMVQDKYREYYHDTTDLLWRMTQTLEGLGIDKSNLKRQFNPLALKNYSQKNPFIIGERYLSSFYTRMPSHNNGASKFEVVTAYQYQYDTKFNSQDLLTDLKIIRDYTNGLEKHPQRSFLRRKFIERSLFSIPAPDKEGQESYWNAISDKKSVYVALKLMTQLQNSYLMALSESKPIPEPTHLITMQTFLTFFVALIKKYYSGKYASNYGLYIHFYGSILLLLESELFYISDGKWSLRSSALSNFLRGENATDITLEMIRQTNKISSEVLRNGSAGSTLEQLKRSYEKYNNVTILSLTNEDEALFYLTLRDSPLSLPQEALEEANVFAIAEVFRMIHGNYREIYSNTTKQEEIILDNRQWSRYVNANIKSQAGFYLDIEFQSSYLYLSPKDVVKSLHLHSYQETTFVERFKLHDFNYPKTRTSNQIQVYDSAAALTREKAERQVVLNTRVKLDDWCSYHINMKLNGKATITVNSFLSKLDKLGDIDYQNLIKVNFFEADSFCNECIQNPKVIDNIIKLIEEGLAYHQNGTVLAFPIHFLLKITFMLRSYVSAISQHKSTALEKREIIRQTLEPIAHIIQRLNEYLDINDPSKKSVASVDLRRATILQQQLHYNELQEIEFYLENEGKINSELLEAFINCKFNIEKYDMAPTLATEKIDPILRSIEDNVIYHLLPALEKYFQDKPENVLQKIIHKLPQSVSSNILKPEVCEFSFPVLQVGDKNDPYYIDVVRGKAEKAQFTLKATPGWLQDSEVFQEFCRVMEFEPKEMMVNNTEKLVEFSHNKENYRAYQHYGTIYLYKKLGEKNKEWYMLNNKYNCQMANLPHSLCDREFYVWFDSHLKSCYFTNKRTKKEEYVLIDNKILGLSQESKSRAEVIQLNSLSTLNEGNLFSFLARIEGGQFIRSEMIRHIGSEDLSNISFYLHRYEINFSWRTMDATGQALETPILLFENDTRYKVASHAHSNLLPGFHSYLELEPCKAEESLSRQILLPRLPFITIGKKEIDLDKMGIVCSDELYLDRKNQDRGSFDASYSHPIDPDQWILRGQCQYYQIAINSKGLLEPATAEEALYLCYVAAAKGIPNLVANFLEDFKRLGGFKGTRSEATIVFWLLNCIPYQVQTKIMKFRMLGKEAFQESNRILSPELCAVRLHILGVILEFKASQAEFALKGNHREINTNSKWYENSTKRLSEFFNTENLLCLLENCLDDYHQIQKNIPKGLKLSASHHYYYFTFIDVQNVKYSLKLAASKVQKQYLANLESHGNSAFLEYYPKLTKPEKKWSRFALKPMNIEFPLLSSEVETDVKYAILYSDKDCIPIWKLKKLESRPFAEAFDSYYNFLKESLIKQKNEGQITKPYCASSNPFPESLDRLKVIEEFKRLIIEYLKEIQQLKSFDLVDIPEVITLENSLPILATILLYVATYPEHFKSILIIEKEDYLSKLILGKLFETVRTLSLKSPIQVLALGRFDEALEEDVKLSMETVEPLSIEPATSQNLPTHSKPHPSLKIDPSVFQLGLIPKSTALISAVLSKLEIPEPPGLSTEQPAEGKEISEALTLNFEGMDREDYQLGALQNYRDMKFKQWVQRYLSDAKCRSTIKSDIIDIIAKYIHQFAVTQRELVSIFNGLSLDAKTRDEELRQRIGFESNTFTLEDIIQLLLKGEIFQELYRIYPTDDQKINEVLHQLSRHLMNGLTIQHYNQILKTLKTVEEANNCPDANRGSIDHYQQELLNLGQLMYETNSYGVDDKSFVARLVYEFSQNVLIKQHQTKLIFIKAFQHKILDMLAKRDEKLGTYVNQVYQSIMGSGKTKIIIPNMAQEKAKGNNLVVTVVPEASRDTNLRDLHLTSYHAFRQKALNFSFSRNTECSVRNLQWIRNYLIHCLIEKNYLVCSHTDFPSVELKWLELLDKKNLDEMQITLLEQILNIPKDGYFDEIDKLLDIRKELNYTIQSLRRIRMDVIKNSILLFSLFAEVKFNVSDREWKLSDVFSREFPDLSEALWKKLFSETIARAFAKVLAENEYSPLTPLLEKQTLKEHRNDLISYLAGKNVPVNKGLPVFFDSLENPEKELIVYYRGQIKHLLSLTLHRKPNKNYGRLLSDFKKIDLSIEVAIPFAGNGVANLSSQFQSVFETIDYTIQLNYIFGLSKQVVYHFISVLQTQANHEKTIRGLSSLDQTDAGILFFDLTQHLFVKRYGVARTLANIDIKNIKEIEETFNILCMDRRIIDFCLENYILTQVKLPPRVLRHNSLNNADMFTSLQGGSGTILSPFVFSERVVFDEKSSKGTDGRTLDHLYQKNPQHVVARNYEMLEEFEQLIKSDAKIRAIIDVGAYFCGISNHAVAKWLAKIYQTLSGNTVKYILYYTEANILSALSVNDPLTCIELGGSSPQEIQKRLQCGPSEYSTYYDDVHTVGTDIAQMFFARAVVTVGSQTLLKDFLQGCKRMRDDSQDWVFFIPKSLYQAYFDAGSASNAIVWNLETTLTIVGRAQRNRILQDNFRVALYKLKAIIRKELVLMLRKESNFKTKQDIYHDILDILTTENDDLPDRYAGQEKPVLTADILKKEYDTWLGLWTRVNEQYRKQIDEALKIKVETEMSGVLKKSETLCDKYTSLQCETDDLEVQTITEVNTNLNTHQNNQMETLTQLDVMTFDYVVRAEAATPTPWSLKPVLETFDLPQAPMYSVWPKSYLLNDVVQPDKDKKRSVSSVHFNEDIHITENYLRTLPKQDSDILDPYVKPVGFVLFIQNNSKQTLKLLLLTHSEACFFASLIKEYNENAGSKPQDKVFWITTTHELKFMGEKPELLHPDYSSLLEQVWFFNGDTQIMSKHVKRLKWIHEDMTIKLNFYETVILACHPDKTELYPHFKLHLLKLLEKPNLLYSQMKLYGKTSVAPEVHDFSAATNAGPASALGKVLDSLENHPPHSSEDTFVPLLMSRIQKNAQQLENETAGQVNKSLVK